MHDSRRYRDSAAECLLAAQQACQPYYRKLHLSMAASWLSLARQDEAIDNLVASWDLVHDPQTFVSGNRLQAGTETKWAVRRRSSFCAVESL